MFRPIARERKKWRIIISDIPQFWLGIFGNVFRPWFVRRHYLFWGSSEKRRRSNLVLRVFSLAWGHPQAREKTLGTRLTSLENIFEGLCINQLQRCPSPPGNNGTFAHVVSPGGGALLDFIAARGLDISIRRGAGDPRAFDTRVFERWVYREGRGLNFVKDLLLRRQGLEKPVDVFKSMFSQF